MIQPALSDISVQSLVMAARRAMQAVIPIADELGIRWQEPENYHGWDTVARGIFDGFVLEAVRSSDGWGECFPLLSYDTRITDFKKLSYIAVDQNGLLHPLVCLESQVAPLDSCLVAELQSDLLLKRCFRLPIDDCRLVAVGGKSSGDVVLSDKLSWS